MREGEWKLVSEVGQGWELYNMSEDRTEQYDLSETEADRLKDMQTAYHKWMKRCGVADWPIPPNKWNPAMRAPHAHLSPSTR